MQASQKRQCWECLRRRLVCDFTQPSCKKCIKFGVNCPGYDEKKPLKWLPPGKVNSKRAERPDARKGKGLILKEMASYNLGEHFSPEYVLEQVSLTIASLRSEDDQSEQDIEEIPRFDLLDETSEVVRAVQYCKLSFRGLCLQYRSLVTHISFFRQHAGVSGNADYHADGA